MEIFRHEDAAALGEMQAALRHYRSLRPYTRDAVRAAIKEIREGDYPEGIAELMNARADELATHLEFILNEDD